MSVKIYPKVNVFLKIIGFKEGFHQLHSRFILAKGDLYDEMDIYETQKGFTLLGDFGCATEHNTIYKAQCALQDYLKKNGKDSVGVKYALNHLCVEVQKNIPKGAGLGGSSGNAGVFLQMMNERFELGMSVEELCQVALSAGADVSFFASGYESANVFGRGENLERFNENSPVLEIHTPEIFCDTKAVYQYYAHNVAQQIQTYSDPALSLQWVDKTSLLLLENATKIKNARCFFNDLYASALKLYPQLESVADELGEQWFFSGSGSSFFRLKDGD
ncbi:4-(cytidine 5'-diphospho)-2-C-methyl-D-erythritol kinase [Helicobacter sp. MIT 05-5293]|uniref:4-(cytidine 5'-diphospho)-2-C-methyl-D-erythritol kinase n=1 Tax=Helicobacter sp. MIT 05-5293 TaxID=1548149 RepID=UPI0010FD36C6|nr:4-(cytidine 5'-diphospho)-2-C-methyl-D-erythritol kinase [Helicobacter sp. MIT 05-5293]TLD81906.1 4-(cytidine 5'-diphospho)-2-C-methyl-D-erythritol kinase [Helicobacter sp. MIT 05-5293]